MTKPELLTLVRIWSGDARLPYLSSDDEINLYITEAEREASERALYLRTDASHTIAVLSGTATYAISNDIIFIDSARLEGLDKPLIKITRAELDMAKSGWRSDLGTPEFYWLEGDNLSLYPKPNANFSLLIEGSRRVSEAMETPAHLHESLAYWVLYRIYSKPDADLLNPRDADKNLQLFISVFGHKRTAWFDAAWRTGKTEVAIPCGF